MKHKPPARLSANGKTPSCFLANVDFQVQVRYMLMPIRLSSVTLVRPTHEVEILGNFTP